MLSSMVNPITVFGNFTNSLTGPRFAVKDDRFWQTHEGTGLAEYTSIGPYRNEVTTTYEYGGAAHHIRLLAHVSPDILLVHQSKVAGFYLVTSANLGVDPINRGIKDMLLKESGMRITNNNRSKSALAGVATSTAAGSTSGGFSY